MNDSTSTTTNKTLTLENPHVFGFNTGLNIGNSIVSRGRWQGDGLSDIIDMATIQMRKENNANYGDSYLSFQTRYETDRSNGGAGTLTEKMRITGNGNVGIGESSPAELLHIRGTGPHMLIEGASNENGKIDFSSGPSYRTSRHQIESHHYALSGNGYRNWLAFNVNEGGESTPSTRMVIRGDGRVGIGTTNPTTALEISRAFTANDDTSAMISFTNSVTNYHEWQIGPTIYSGSAGFGIKGGADGFGNLSDVIAIRDTDVGIGTSSPLGKLHVQTEARTGTEGSGDGIYVTANLGEYFSGSEFRHSNQSQGTGIGYAGIYATGSNTNQDLNIVSRGTGTTYVKNYAVFSDDRIKTNEEYITNATETLMKLKPQVYDKHEEINVISDNPKREAGLIAQDIYYDAPELRYIVSTRNGGMNTEPVDIPPEKPFVDEDPTKDPDYSSWGTGSAGVAYIQLVPYLIKSIQELQERIKVLENA